MNWINSLAATLSFATMLILSPASAQACRDCPFPMRVGTNQWLLPESNLVVSIITGADRHGSKVYTRIILKDQNTGHTVATGGVYRNKHQRNMTVVLRDERGRRVAGSIYWVQFDEPVIRARFACLDLDCAVRGRD